MICIICRSAPCVGLPPGKEPLSRSLSESHFHGTKQFSRLQNSPILSANSRLHQVPRGIQIDPPNINNTRVQLRAPQHESGLFHTWNTLSASSIRRFKFCKLLPSPSIIITYIIHYLLATLLCYTLSAFLSLAYQYSCFAIITYIIHYLLATLLCYTLSAFLSLAYQYCCFAIIT